jgi:hypothetical protein
MTNLCLHGIIGFVEIDDILFHLLTYIGGIRAVIQLQQYLLKLPSDLGF